MRMGIGMGLSRRGGGGSAPFDPASLFAGGEQGGVYDFTAASGTMGTKITSVDDDSGNGNDASQATAARQPYAAGVPHSVGSELLTGGYDFSDAAWTLGSNMDTSGVVTAGTATSTSQPLSGVSEGDMIAIQFSATRTAGTYGVRLSGSTTVTGVALNKARSHTEYLRCPAGSVDLEVFWDASYAGTVHGCSVKVVSAVDQPAAYVDGINNFLQTADIDLSGGSIVTVVASVWHDDRLANGGLLDFGNYGASTAGSFYITQNPGDLLARDASTSNNKVSLDGSPSATFESRLRTMAFQVDLSESLLSDELTLLHGDGIDTPPVTHSGSAMTGNLANGPLTFGAWGNAALDWRGMFRRVLFINRALTSGELSDAVAWAKNGAINCAFVGDSTVAANTTAAGLPSDTWSVAAYCGWGEFGIFDISEPGHEISQQKTAWQALSDYSGLEAVFVCIGQNDVKDGDSTSVITTNLQDLIDTIAADVNAGCKIYCLALTPSHGWLANEAQRTVWDELNANIEGTGGTPITGIDAAITGKASGRYWNDLNDGADSLAANFDHNSDGVHPSNAGRFIIAQAIRAQVAADGLI